MFPCDRCEYEMFHKILGSLNHPTVQVSPERPVHNASSVSDDSKRENGLWIKHRIYSAKARCCTAVPT